MASCAAGAIVKQDNGLVLIDRNKCQSLQSCITACPFLAPQIADDRQEPKKNKLWGVNHPAQKCKLCWERLQDGQKPICVAACPVNAIDYGDIYSLMREYPDAVRLNKDDFPYVYRENAVDNTLPSMLVRKKDIAFSVTKETKQDNTGEV